MRRPPTRLELSLHDQRRLHDHLLYLFDNDIDHYEMAIHDWDHTHEVLRQDYDLDYTTGWDGDFNEHTYIPPARSLPICVMMRDQMAAADVTTIEGKRRGRPPQLSVGACTTTHCTPAT